jgi:hypothetical protein
VGVKVEVGLLAVPVGVSVDPAGEILHDNRVAQNHEDDSDPARASTPQPGRVPSRCPGTLPWPYGMGCAT